MPLAPSEHVPAAGRGGRLPLIPQVWAQLAGRVSERLPIGAATSATPGLSNAPLPDLEVRASDQWLLSVPAPVGPARAESSSSPRSSARRSARPLTSLTPVSAPRGRPLVQPAPATLPPPRPRPGPAPTPTARQRARTCPCWTLERAGRRARACGSAPPPEPARPAAQGICRRAAAQHRPRSRLSDPSRGGAGCQAWAMPPGGTCEAPRLGERSPSRTRGGKRAARAWAPAESRQLNGPRGQASSGPPRPSRRAPSTEADGRPAWCADGQLAGSPPRLPAAQRCFAVCRF